MLRHRIVYRTVAPTPHMVYRIVAPTLGRERHPHQLQLQLQLRWRFALFRQR